MEVFDPEGNYLRTLGTSARGPDLFTAPQGLAVDPAGRLLVSDTVGDRIEELAGGSESFLGQWTAAGGAFGAFNEPAGIAVNPGGSVYVADRGNGRLAHLWGDGTYLGEVAGPAEVGGAQLSDAGSVAVVASTGDTYVADTAHNRILLYGPEGTLLARWGADGGDGASGSAAGEFDHPDAVAVNGGGDAFVADTGNERVVELSPSGSPLNEWGYRGTGDGRFHSPTGIALDGAGDVYVLDSENNRVQVFGPAGRFLFKWGLRGIGAGEFSQPGAIAVGCEGSVYVADTNNNRVERFDLLAPNPSGCVAAGSWPPPLDVAPVLRVALPRPGGILSRRALALLVSCQRGCRILVSATLGPLGGRGPVRLITVARTLSPGLAGHVRLLVSSSALRRMRHELGSRHAMQAHVTIIAEGPTGRRTTLTRSFRVAR